MSNFDHIDEIIQKHVHVTGSHFFFFMIYGLLTVLFCSFPQR